MRNFNYSYIQVLNEFRKGPSKHGINLSSQVHKNRKKEANKKQARKKVKEYKNEDNEKINENIYRSPTEELYYHENDPNGRLVANFINRLGPLSGKMTENIVKLNNKRNKISGSYYGYDILDEFDEDRLSIFHNLKGMGNWIELQLATHLEPGDKIIENLVPESYKELITRAVQGFVNKPYIQNKEFDFIMYPSSGSYHVVHIARMIKSYKPNATIIEHKKLNRDIMNLISIFDLSLDKTLDEKLEIPIVKAFMSAIFNENINNIGRKDLEILVNDLINSIINALHGRYIRNNINREGFSVADDFRSVFADVFLDRVIGIFINNDTEILYSDYLKPVHGRTNVNGRMDRFMVNSLFDDEGTINNIGFDGVNVLVVDDNINTGAMYKQIEGLIGDKNIDVNFDFFFLIKKGEYAPRSPRMIGRIEDIETDLVPINSRINELENKLQKTIDGHYDFMYSTEEKKQNRIREIETEIEKYQAKKQPLEDEKENIKRLTGV